MPVEHRLKHPPIDHIALSSELAPHTNVIGAWEGTDADGVRLSDHSGLVVEIRTRPRFEEP